MHQVIRIICYAKTSKEAREEAEGILNKNLVGEFNSFDYGTFFDDETARASGKARWGNFPAVVLANSEEGKKLIREGMKFTKDYFMENLKYVTKAINCYSYNELFEGKLLNPKTKILEALKNTKSDSLAMFKYYCSCLGQYQGSKIFLYDNDGEGIRNNSTLKNVLNKWKSLYKNKVNPYRDMKVWVVPCDVHS